MALLWRQQGNILSVEPHAAAVRLFDSCHDFEQRAFAAARCAEQGGGFSRRYSHADADEQWSSLWWAKMLDDVAQFQHGWGVKRQETERSWVSIRIKQPRVSSINRAESNMAASR